MSDYEKGCEAMRVERWPVIGLLRRCAKALRGACTASERVSMASSLEGAADTLADLPIPPAPQEPAKQPPYDVIVAAVAGRLADHRSPGEEPGNAAVHTEDVEAARVVIEDVAGAWPAKQPSPSPSSADDLAPPRDAPPICDGDGCNYAAGHRGWCGPDAPPAEPLYPPHGEPVYTEEEYAAAKKQPPAVSDESACPVNADGAENRTPADAAREMLAAIISNLPTSAKAREIERVQLGYPWTGSVEFTVSTLEKIEALLHGEQQDQGREQPQGGGE